MDSVPVVLVSCESDEGLGNFLRLQYESKCSGDGLNEVNRQWVFLNFSNGAEVP